MSKDNNNKNSESNEDKKKSTHKKNKNKKRVILRILLLVSLIVVLVTTGALAGMVIGIAKSAPTIDPTNVLTTLTESSVIVDENDNIVEQIHDPNENREIVKLNDIPNNVRNAFISIEDHRFKDHFGIDIRRILGSLIYNVKVGDPTAQGASTITQQLVKNLYLTNEKSWERKIKEIYLAIQVERKLSKDQILENYLNTIPLGQSSYGVQTAAHTYFNKDVKNLTLAESALMAGAARSTVYYAPFNRYNLKDIQNIPEKDIVGYVYIGSVQYACVYNEKAIERQKVILKRMLNLGNISQDEYDTALKEDMRVALNPGQTKVEGISSTPMDYVKERVVRDLMATQNLKYEDAESYLYKGGLKITTTIDVKMQQTLEESYKNFAKLYLGAEPTGDKPIAVDWRTFKWEDEIGVGTLDSSKNILNEYGQIIYLAKNNLMDVKDIYLNENEYSYDKDGNLIIKSKKFDIYKSSIDIVDVYTIDKKHNLVSHNVGALNIGNNYEVLEQKGTKGSFKIPKSYMDKNPKMFVKASNNRLIIPEGYFYFQEDGIVQPQSAAVILDYKTGKIKALIGGRDIEGSKTFNRATDAARQPGSTIKPLSVYMPSIDLGFSPAYILDDLPRYDENNERWPKNWYEYKDIKYLGITTLRKSVEQSINTNAVSMLEQIGIEASIKSLKNLGLIDEKDPKNDTFITAKENPSFNDENLASLGLGGLTKGFSPLDMTAAYGTIANDGVYVEPIAYTKVENNRGEKILDNVPKTKVAISPEVSSLMRDVLKTTVTNGLSYRAKLPASMGIDVAGKTGTTQASGDFWFMGFTPYYVGGIWVGNDNVQLKLSGDSGANARLWSAIMTPIHEGLKPANFVINKNLVEVEVCAQSGELPTELCSLDQRGTQVIKEYFIPGTQPTQTCTTHVLAEVCTTTNQLKSQFCPPNLVEKKVFITRDPLYDPEHNEENFEAKKLYQQVIEDKSLFSIAELKQVYLGQVTIDENNNITHVLGVPVENLSFSGLITEDYKYQIPTKTCTAHTQWHLDNYNNQQQNPANNDKPSGTVSGTGINEDVGSNIINNIIENTNTDIDGIIESISN